MLTHPTHDRMVALGLTGMAKALEEQRQQPDIATLSFEERLALMGSGRFNLAQGIIGTASGIGAALSTAVFGLIAANFGHTTTFLSMAAVALLGASIMWLLMPETRPSTEK